MKHFKLISLLSIIFAFSTAQAETTVNGELWADFDVVLDNGAGDSGGDAITPMGTDINRARVGVMHSFNSDWSANVKIDAAEVGNNGNANVVRANIVAKNWLADGSTLVFGKQNNAYRAAYDNFHNNWLHRDLTSDLTSELSTAYSLDGLANINNFTGISVHHQFNDMWKAALSVNSGPTDELNNGGNGGTSHDVVGYSVMVEGWFTEEVGLLLGHDTFSAGVLDGDDTDADNVDGFAATRATLIYKTDMLRASLEYAMFSHDNDTVGTEVEDASVMALSLDYMMGDNFAHLYYASTTDFDTAGIDGGLESSYRLGYNWGLADNLNTGVYYTANTRDTADSDESLVEWKWAANF